MGGSGAPQQYGKLGTTGGLGGQNGLGALGLSGPGNSPRTDFSRPGIFGSASNLSGPKGVKGQDASGENI